MKTKFLLPAFLVVAVGVAVCSVLMAIRQSSSLEAAPEAMRDEAALKPGKAASIPEAATPVITATNDSMIEMPTPPLVVKVETNATQAAPRTPPVKQPKEEIQDPDAREALSHVGADPDADAYWIGAINNPDLSDDERKNLIEDLNEDGLSDPHNPGPEDIPLIENRLQLIEDLAPDAMDQVNADAFQEAYKDLLNILDKLSAQ